MIHSPLVIAQNLRRTWTKDPVFDALNLSIRRGDYLAIAGQSGAGKSTLLRVLGALDKNYEGSLTIFDHRVKHTPDRILSRLRNEKLSFVFQSHQLLPHLTIQENILLPWAYRRSEPRLTERLHELLTALGIDDKRYDFPDELSGGQQQRVAIARALITQPELLLCDELTGNLDRHTADQVMHILEEYQRQSQCAIVVVSHDPQVLARAKTRMTLQNGTLEEFSTPSSRPSTTR